MKFRNSNCDEIQKVQLWWNSNSQIVKKKNSKTQIVPKLKKSNYCQTQKLLWWNQNFDELQKLNLWWYSKTQMVTKLKKSNCDISKKKTLKMWQKSKTQIVTQLKFWPNTNCDTTKNVMKKTQLFKMWQNSNCDTTQELKLGQNSKTQMVTKLKL